MAKIDQQIRLNKLNQRMRSFYVFKDRGFSDDEMHQDYQTIGYEIEEIIRDDGFIYLHYYTELEGAHGTVRLVILRLGVDKKYISNMRKIHKKYEFKTFSVKKEDLMKHSVPEVEAYKNRIRRRDKSIEGRKQLTSIVLDLKEMKDDLMGYVDNQECPLHDVGAVKRSVNQISDIDFRLKAVLESLDTDYNCYN